MSARLPIKRLNIPMAPKYCGMATGDATTVANNPMAIDSVDTAPKGRDIRCEPSFLSETCLSAIGNSATHRTAKPKTVAAAYKRRGL